MRTRVWMMAAVVGVGIAMVAATLWQAEPVGAAEQAKEPATFSGPIQLQKIKSQVVLYTLYRGPYQQVGPAIGKLFALAGQKGIQVHGPLLLSYLNNPKMTEPQHYLTEIRIPVAPEALAKTGTLGEFTDVKKLQGIQVAMAVKPTGMADPGPVYAALMRWMAERDYVAIDSPMERWRAAAGMASYAEMEAEIMIPVEKYGNSR